MDEEQILTGATSNEVTPELAESLPYAELKQRMRDEAAAFESATSNPNPGGGQDGDEDEVVDATTTNSGTARDEQQQQQNQQRTNDQGTRTTEREYKRPETLEEAIRVLDSLRGNLNSAVGERAALQKQIQDIRAEAARQAREAEQNALTAQHNQVMAAIRALPTPAQQQAALSRYQQQIREMAAGEALTHVETQQQQLEQRTFELDKREVPGMYADIARFVAEQRGIKPDALVAFAGSERIQNMIAAARNPQALQAVSVVLGETLDEMAVMQAGREAAAKEERRKAKTATLVRDVPLGTVPGAGNEDEVARINKMTPDEFKSFKQKLLEAAR